MKNILIYPVGSTQAIAYAERFLRKSGVSSVDHPSPEVTHLLLDIPSFDSDGKLRHGGDPERVLERLPQNVTVVGGNLQHPALDGYKTLDLLHDPRYLALNAGITAECALQIAFTQMNHTFRGSSVLVIGWGRIGKSLSQLLKSLGCVVTVAARKEEDRAMLEVLGYIPMDTDALELKISDWQVVFNTVPYPIIRNPEAPGTGRIWIDLASKRGLAAENTLWVRGLPGKHAPESSGKLIAESILRHLKEEQT